MHYYAVFDVSGFDFKQISVPLTCECDADEFMDAMKSVLKYKDSRLVVACILSDSTQPKTR
jgi:hypothetical protein